MNIISRVISGWWLVVSGCLFMALMLAACSDFHGPWDYYPEERNVYLGIYTYGYIMPGEYPYICFSKVYELDETSAEDFAFYDSAYVTVSGRFSISGKEIVDTTMVLQQSGSPNCFENGAFYNGTGVEGETYTMEAYFVWDSAGHTAKSRYKAEAKIPEAVRVKGLNVPQQDGSYKWMEYDKNEEITVQFLEFPMDMEFIKCALDYDHSARGVISVMNYGIENAESQKTTINQMFKGMIDADSEGYRGIALHDPLETSQQLGYTSNSKVADYYALDTLYLMNMMMPLGKISVDFYATDAAYIDYESKVKGSVSDSRIIPESNIENGMGVFSGMAKTTIELFVEGTGVSMEHIAKSQCQDAKGDLSDSWDSRGCRLYQDVYCAGDVDMQFWRNGLIGANKDAYNLYRDNDSIPNIGVKSCYASQVKAAMMLDTTKWSIFLPDTINEKDKNNAYGDGLKRYCVASNFKSNHIADCTEMYEQCIESPEKNNCKEYLWMWCADRNWDLSYEQCKAALVSRYYIEKPKSDILKREVEAICYFWKEEVKDNGKKKIVYHLGNSYCENWCKVSDKGGECQ